MKRAITFVKLAVLAAVFAVTLVSVQAPVAEASYVCIGGTKFCPYEEGFIWRMVFIP